jgi:L-threonylcarbamoyladenylate synthase
MKTEVISITSSKAQSAAIEILLAGGLVAFPTDTVYGLGALVFNEMAVASLYIAKNRPADKAVPVLLAGVEALPEIALSVPTLALILASHFWPGPVTLVILKHPDLPDIVSITPTVGVRVPGPARTRELLKLSGPLAVTSANISGQPSPSTAGAVLAQLAGRIPLILDGGQTPGGIPSTVVDCLGAEPKILREGPVSNMEIRKFLGLE